MPDTHATHEPTLDDIKQEVLRRSEKRLQPFNHVHHHDVEKIVAALKSLDKDHWAELWYQVGLEYEKQGDDHEKTGEGKSYDGVVLFIPSPLVDVAEEMPEGQRAKYLDPARRVFQAQRKEQWGSPGDKRYDAYCRWLLRAAREFE